jgi:hypothetical protein
MNKSKYADYLRMLKLREQLAVTTDPNPEAAKELKELEQSPEKEEKNLTTEESSV